MNTYRSRADIDGGSAINSNSAGGSLGINGCSMADLRSSCCFCCTAATVLEVAVVPGGPIWAGS